MELHVSQPKPGDCLKARSMASYALPAGLNDGDEVQCISFNYGFWLVEKDGQTFEVFASCLEIEPPPCPPARKRKR